MSEISVCFCLCLCVFPFLYYDYISLMVLFLFVILIIFFPFLLPSSSSWRHFISFPTNSHQCSQFSGAICASFFLIYNCGNQASLGADHTHTRHKDTYFHLAANVTLCKWVTIIAVLSLVLCSFCVCFEHFCPFRLLTLVEEGEGESG